MATLLSAASLATSAAPALAQRAGDTGDTRLARSAEEGGAGAYGWRRRWEGSYVSFDQSATTQTVHVGSDYQSADPVYELWLAVKPQLNVLDRPSDKLSVSVWLNAFLELTNSDTTTRTHEIQLGPTYVTAPYVHTLGGWFAARPGYKTSLSVGPRLVLPTDKVSFDSGQIASVGATGSVAQAIPLRGESAHYLKDALFTVAVSSGRPFARATAPVNPDLRLPVEDVAGRLIASDQLRGQLNSKAFLNFTAAADVRLSARWAATASYVVLNSWAYTPGNDPVCNLLTGCAAPLSVDDPSTHRVSTWLTTSVTFDLRRHVGLTLGYYNRATQVGPDGQRRSPLWSPEARFFVTATGTLASDPEP